MNSLRFYNVYCALSTMIEERRIEIEKKISSMLRSEICYNIN